MRKVGSDNLFIYLALEARKPVILGKKSTILPLFYLTVINAHGHESSCIRALCLFWHEIYMLCTCCMTAGLQGVWWTTKWISVGPAKQGWCQCAHCFPCCTLPPHLLDKEMGGWARMVYLSRRWALAICCPCHSRHCLTPLELVGHC